MLAGLAAAVLFSFLTAVSAGAQSAHAAPVPGTGLARTGPLVVRTDKGAVHGLVSGDAREFLGIPYAAPPVGSLRWRRPQPAMRWQGVRDATKPGSTCAQTGSIATGVPNTSTAEDCLYLNVYAPRDASFRRLPVMVWIHGGGFTGGAGSIYDASVIAPKGNAIVVTINYRLGALGYLALPSLDSESADHSSGDYGLMDQQAALRWVRRNAAAFGGDARNVTIFGESAGAASVCDNMASPTAAGLFTRAIAESGCLLGQPSQQAAEQHGGSFAASLGCSDPATAAACLRAKPVSDLLNAPGGGLLSWAPVTGGSTLPLPVATAFAEGRYAHVPLLNGTNRDEGRFFVALEFDALGHPLTAAQYQQILAASYGSNAAQVLAHYPLSAYASPDLAYASVLTDTLFSCPALQADNLAWRSRVYGYEFADPSPPNDFGLTFSFPLGAAHSTELQYVFQRIPLLDTVPPFTPSQLALSDQMIGYWTRFAATGDPNGFLGFPRTGAAGPYWPLFTPQRGQIQDLVPRGTHPSTGFAAEHQCAFWNQLGA